MATSCVCRPALASRVGWEQGERNTSHETTEVVEGEVEEDGVVEEGEVEVGAVRVEVLPILLEEGEAGMATVTIMEEITITVALTTPTTAVTTMEEVVP